MNRYFPDDLAGRIIEYETGALSAKGILELFSRLVQTGLAWTLQGSYGRTARALIECGFLEENGNITPKGAEAVTE